MTALVVSAVLVGALAQSVSGIGFSLVSGPVLIAVLGAHEGVRLGVVLSLLVNVVLLTRHRREVHRRVCVLLLVPAVVVTPLAALGVRALPNRPAQAGAGAVVVLGAALLALGARWPAARGSGGAVGVSVVSSVTNVVAGVAGPPIALWADNAGWSAATTRATLQAYFLGLNLVTLASLGAPSSGARVVVTAVLALVAGLLLGGPLARRVSERLARRATLTMAAAGGLVVLLRAAA